MSDLMLHGVLNMPLPNDPKELKPCPWCKGTASRRETTGYRAIAHYVTSCTNSQCSIQPTSKERFTQDQADYEWNTRSDLAVEVKPLVWVEEHDFHCSEVWDCDTILGLYSVFKGHDQSAYSFEFESGPDPAQDGFADIDAAKAAAQADYNARILSALTTRPDDLRPKLQALLAKWEGMTCRTKCAQELREVLEGGV